MNWERTMRELHSIRARMRREELKMLMRQEAAEKITGRNAYQSRKAVG
jgi:hypothetical protein